MNAVVHLDAAYYTENDTRYVFLDGSSCKKLDDCYTCLQQQLSIPHYFGKNLDALEEVLADLEWVNERKINIIIMNETSLLEDDIAKKNIFLDILHGAGNKKIHLIYLGKLPHR